MVQKVGDGSRVETTVGHPVTGRLCQPCSKLLSFFELGKDKAAKERIWKDSAINMLC